MSEQRSVGSIADTVATPKTLLQKLHDSVGKQAYESVRYIFILLGLAIVLSHLFYLLGTSVAYEVVNPRTHQVEHATVGSAVLRKGRAISIAEAGQTR